MLTHNHIQSSTDIESLCIYLREGALTGSIPSPMAAVHPSSSGLQTDQLCGNTALPKQSIQHKRTTNARECIDTATASCPIPCGSTDEIAGFLNLGLDLWLLALTLAISQ